MKLRSIVTVIALIMIMFMAAIETSIISLGPPSINRDLNAGKHISLVVTVYFIALVIANPIVGEFISRFKIMFVAICGVILFGIGSLMSGLSDTFTLLIISRIIQGFGAGVIMSLSQIVPKLAFEIPLRYKVMGIVGSVWGISSIVGPLVGGGILEVATWHWLFFINLPIAIIAIVLIIFTFNFKEEEVNKNINFDAKGLTLFYIFIGLLMYGLLNQTMFILNIVSLILAVCVAVLLYKVEKKSDHPFLPVIEFNKSISLVFITDLLTALCLMGFNIYIPVYLQEKVGISPLQSGLVIFPLSVAWTIFNFYLGKVEESLTRKTLYLSAFTLIIVSSIIILFGLKLPLLIALSVILAGVGFGYIYTKDSVIVQEETTPNQMKKMMSFYSLTKNLGSSIGSTLMGYLYAIKAGWFGSDLQNILSFVIAVEIILIISWALIYKKQSN